MATYLGSYPENQIEDIVNIGTDDCQTEEICLRQVDSTIMFYLLQIALVRFRSTARVAVRLQARLTHTFRWAKRPVFSIR